MYKVLISDAFKILFYITILEKLQNCVNDKK